MCGIFGFSVDNETTRRMIPVLAIAMESRGSDSWGVTNGLELHKHVGGITKEFVYHPLDHPTYHTRGASVGSVCRRNAHPFEYISASGKIVAGVHNGHINNWWELKKKYHENRKDFEVDSEHIFAQLAENLPLSEIEGWGAVVWYEYMVDRPDEVKRYISCFGNPAMHVARLKTGELVFCSEEKAIRIAARLAGAEVDMFYTIEQQHKYEVGVDGILYEMGPMKWGPDPLPAIRSRAGARSDSSGTFHTGIKGQDTIGEVCLKRGCFRHTTNGGIVCDPCLRMATIDVCGVSGVVA